MTATLTNLRRRNGIAGQFSVSADVTYPHEPTRSIEFVGSIYGGPIVMRTDASETFVTEPERFGKFGPSHGDSLRWVRRFFGVDHTHTTNCAYCASKAHAGNERHMA